MKAGDKVRVVGQHYTGTGRASMGREYTLKAKYSDNYSFNGFCGRAWQLQDQSGDQIWAFEVDLQVISNNMSIKEAFTLAFKSEPEKSFRQAGITNGDDFLTADGQLIFLSWLLKREGDAFKKEVVDGLLEDINKKKDC